MLVRPPGHRLTHVSRKPRAIASGWVPSGQALGTQDTVSPREKLVAQQLGCRTETLDLAEALPRPPSNPGRSSTQYWGLTGQRQALPVKMPKPRWLRLVSAEVAEATLMRSGPLKQDTAQPVPGTQSPASLEMDV